MDGVRGDLGGVGGDTGSVVSDTGSVGGDTGVGGDMGDALVQIWTWALRVLCCGLWAGLRCEAGRPAGTAWLGQPSLAWPWQE